MAISSVPQLLEQSNDYAINSAQATRVQTLSYANGVTTLTINPTNGGIAQINQLTRNVTVSFTGLPGTFTDPYGVVMYQPTIWYVEIQQGATYTVTFSGVTWDGGTAPTLVSTASGKSTIMFTSFDGTTINGKLLYANLVS